MLHDAVEKHLGQNEHPMAPTTVLKKVPGGSPIYECTSWYFAAYRLRTLSVVVISFNERRDDTIWIRFWRAIYLGPGPEPGQAGAVQTAAESPVSRQI